MVSFGRRRHRAPAGLAVAMALVALFVAACSSSGGSPGSSGSSGNSASGSPIVLYGVTTYNNPANSLPEVNDGAQAAAKAINAAGGINGHPLKVTVCDDNFNPNQAQQCAEAAVSNHAAAVVAANEFVDPNYFTTLDKAGIPLIQPCGCSQTELTEKPSFPLDGALPALIYGDAAMLIKMGVKHPASLTCETASCTYDSQLAQQAFKLAGVSLVRTVVSPLASVDDTSAAAEAIAGGVDGVVISSSPQAITKMIAGLRGAGFKGPIIQSSQTFTSAVVKAVGDNTAGLYASATFDPPTDTSDQKVAQYISEMKAYESNPKLDLQSEASWMAVHAFATEAASLKTVTAATVMQAFSNISCSKPLSPGLISPYCTQPPGLSSAPRVLNMSVRQVVDKNGQLVVDGPFFNPISVLKAADTGS